MTRAEKILESLWSVTKTAGPALGVAGTAAGIGVQAAMARKQRDKKISDAGHGEKLQRAKDKVTLARVKSAKALGLSKKRRENVKVAKAERQRVVNKGLHAYAQKTAAEDD